MTMLISHGHKLQGPCDCGVSPWCLLFLASGGQAQNEAVADGCQSSVPLRGRWLTGPTASGNFPTPQ